MERVKPEFCNIYLTTGDKNLQFDKTELFKKFQYKSEKISQAILDQSKAVSGDQFKIPFENPYFPKNFDYVPEN